MRLTISRLKIYRKGLKSHIFEGMTLVFLHSVFFFIYFSGIIVSDNAYSMNDSLTSLNDYEYTSVKKVLHIEDSSIVKFSVEAFKNTFPAKGSVFGKRNNESEYVRLQDFERPSLDPDSGIIRVYTRDFDSLIFAHIYDDDGSNWKRMESYGISNLGDFTYNILDPGFGKLDGTYLLVEVYDKASDERTLFAKMNGQPLYELEIKDEAKPFRISVEALKISQDVIKIDTLRGGNKFRILFNFDKNVFTQRKDEFRKSKTTWLIPIGIRIFDPVIQNRYKDFAIYIKRIDVRAKK